MERDSVHRVKATWSSYMSALRTCLWLIYSTADNDDDTPASCGEYGVCGGGCILYKPGNISSRIQYPSLHAAAHHVCKHESFMFALCKVDWNCDFVCVADVECSFLYTIQKKYDVEGIQSIGRANNIANSTMKSSRSNVWRRLWLFRMCLLYTMHIMRVWMVHFEASDDERWQENELFILKKCDICFLQPKYMYADKLPT